MLPNSNRMAISLAPGAGAGLGKLVFDEILQRAGVPAKIADRMLEGLDAMCPRRWDKASESWVTDPDYRTRMQTVFGLLAQAEGEPIKRVVHEHLASGHIDLAAELRESPELREAIGREMAKADWRHGGGERRRKALRKVGPEPETVELD